MKTQIIIFLSLVSFAAAAITEKNVDSGIDHISWKHVFRNGKKILEIATPVSKNLNTTYIIFTESGSIYKYQFNKSRSSFQDWRFPDSNYNIKLHTTSKWVVADIIIYSKDYTKTIEAFHIKDHRLIPFSDNELKNHRLLRDR